MATVLSFEAALRRRTPAWAQRALATRDAQALERFVPATAARVDERQLARTFFPILALVAALDLATKAWAASVLAGHVYALLPGLSLSLVYNGASAGGVSLGESTRAINFAATGIVVGLLVAIAPTLARFDRRSTVALALAAGGGVGNLVSLAAGGRGVVDFIVLHRPHGAWVINVADVALLAGLLLLGRTVAVLFRAARRGAAVGA